MSTYIHKTPNRENVVPSNDIILGDLVEARMKGTRKYFSYRVIGVSGTLQLKKICNVDERQEPKEIDEFVEVHKVIMQMRAHRRYLPSIFSEPNPSSGVPIDFTEEMGKHKVNVWQLSPDQQWAKHRYGWSIVNSFKKRKNVLTDLGHQQKNFKKEHVPKKTTNAVTYLANQKNTFKEEYMPNFVDEITCKQTAKVHKTLTSTPKEKMVKKTTNAVKDLENQQNIFKEKRMPNFVDEITYTGNQRLKNHKSHTSTPKEKMVKKTTNAVTVPENQQNPFKEEHVPNFMDEITGNQAAKDHKSHTSTPKEKMVKKTKNVVKEPESQQNTFKKEHVLNFVFDPSLLGSL
jgi:hypothetical protein